MRNFWMSGILILLLGCKSSGPLSSGGAEAYASYSEDLSGSLPEYPDFRKKLEENAQGEPVTSVQSVDDELDTIQKRLYEKNKSEPYFSGYTVLVYSGIDRNQAFKTRDDLVGYFPEINAEMQYQEPRYLVKVGKYAYKFEAQKNFSQIKNYFPSARIIQDRFQRQEYVAPTAPISTDPNATNSN
jgi:hypothetical protein